MKRRLMQSRGSQGPSRTRLLNVVVAVCLMAALGLAALTQSDMVSAAAATMVPDSETVSGWGVGVADDTSCSGGTLCDTVDEGAADETADYIRTTSTGGGETVTFGLSDVSNIDSATQLTVRIYAKANAVGGGGIDTLNVSLLVNGAVSTTQTCTPGNGSWAACTVTLSGAWNQADVNSMQVRIVRTIQGGGKKSKRPDDTWIANVYGSLTYAPSLTLEQSAYRWYENQDVAGGLAFVKTYGGSDNEGGQSLVQTTDGGYAVTGDTTSYSAGFSDMFLAKYDASGTLSWSKTWGGSGFDFSGSLIQTTDGGYAVTGKTDSYGAGRIDMFLAKYDASGTLSWSRTWGGSGSDDGQSLVQTTDGGYAVTGNTDSYGAGSDDMFLAKYDASGTLSWSKTWGSSSNEEGQSLVQTADGGYAITGNTDSYGAGSRDMFLAKYDASGTLSWSKTWGDSGYEYGRSLVQAGDGGYAVTGSTSSYGAGSADMFLAKYDASGTLSWSKTWGGSGPDSGNALVKIGNDGYAVTGHTSSYGAGSDDMFLAKYDASGTLSWSRTWGGSGSDSGQSLVQAGDGGYAVTGPTSSYGAGSGDIFLAKYDSSGSIAACSSACTSPTATTTSPTATASSPTVIASSPAVTTASPTAATSSPTLATNTVVAAPKIDVGSSLAANNTPAVGPSGDTIFRLRLNVHVNGGQASANSLNLKLQFAQKGSQTSCSTVTGYGNVTDSTTIRYADNTNATNATMLEANASDPVHGIDSNVLETYQEAGATTFSNPAVVLAGQDGMWDFALTPSVSLTSGTYCFRVVDASGALLDSYSQYPELTVVALPPSVGFVDGSGNPLSSPSFAMTAKDYLTSCQTSTGTLGGANAKLRITQSSSAGNGWNVSIAPTSGDSARWSSPEGGYYDFNDGSGSPPGCFNGSDGDIYAGQLTLNNGTASLTPQSGCSTSGLSLASGATAFSSGSVSAITLLTASSSASSGCYWDLSGIGLSQTIPPSQDPGSYTINLTATVTSS